MNQSTCPFCAIISGRDPNAKIVYQDQHVTAFFPLTPASRGHTLVVPNRHVADLTDITATESRQLGAGVRRTARAVRASVSPEGLNVIQSTGSAATQTVPHVHFHVVPRWANDRVELGWPEEEAEDGAAQNETLATVRSLLPPTTDDIPPEDRRQHLSFIQAIISRMSHASASSKTWLLPIITLTYGYAVTRGQPWVAVLGMLAIIVFGLLDANYLKQERAFRKLYDEVALGGEIPAFSLNPSLAGPEGLKVNYWPDWEDIRSWAIAPVYAPFLLVGVAIIIWERCL